MFNLCITCSVASEKSKRLITKCFRIYLFIIFVDILYFFFLFLILYCTLIISFFFSFLLLCMCLVVWHHLSYYTPVKHWLHLYCLSTLLPIGFLLCILWWDNTRCLSFDNVTDFSVDITTYHMLLSCCKSPFPPTVLMYIHM